MHSLAKEKFIEVIWAAQMIFRPAVDFQVNIKLTWQKDIKTQKDLLQNC